VRPLAVLALILSFAATTAAEAADGPRLRTASRVAAVMPLPPRSVEAEWTAWAQQACWRPCAASCGPPLPACLAVASFNECLAAHDACHRACQVQCRPYGGPLLPLE